jgi:hypothetical protein
MSLFITSNPERIQTSRPKSRHNWRSVVPSVFASSSSWGARPDSCALNITARQSRGAVPDCSVSLSTVVSHRPFGCTHFLFSTLSVYTRAVQKETELFFNLLLYLQLHQTCLLQSTPLYCWYTAPSVFPVLERVLERVLRDGAKVL